MQKEIEIILDSTQDALIAVDRNGIITLYNRAAERLTRARAAAVIGRPVIEVIDNSRLPHVLQSGTAELNQRQALHDITIITSRIPIIDDSGEVIGAFAVFRDITDLTELAEEITNLREITTMFEAIFNSTQDAISVVDRDGIGVLVNPAYTRVTGLTAKDVIGKDCTVDIAAGDSIHRKVLSTGLPLKAQRLQVGPRRKEVIVDAAPIIVRGELRGSVAVIQDVTEIQKLTTQLRQAQSIIRKLQAKYTFRDVIGTDEKILHAVEKAKIAASTPATVLLRGESGTGKELFAHAIHNASERRFGQFVRVNCSALTDSLLESELFGYEEGAFTGAAKGGRAGLFERSDGGTIFLDEIGEMSLHTQSKLLRVLQENEILRVGGTDPIAIDTRVIAATNQDLEQAVRKGQFRKDLYYRLNVIPIDIPPVREHPDDIPLLVQHILRKMNQQYGRGVSDIASDALGVLRSYDWPGNVREMENMIGRAIINMRFTETRIEAGHLPFLSHLHTARLLPAAECEEDESPVDEPANLGLREAVERTERRQIARALSACGGNRTEASRRLGISIRSLHYKISRYHLS